jgi:hypothetical protein
MIRRAARRPANRRDERRAREATMANGEEHERETIGSHSFQFEAPDVFRIWLVGDVSAGEAQAIVDALERSSRPDKRLFLLVDVSRLGAMLPEARKSAVQGQNIPMLASVIVGAGPLQRSVLKLIDLAYRLITQDSNAAPMVFVRTEAEGRAWIEQRRREVSEGSGAGGAPTPPPA